MSLAGVVAILACVAPLDARITRIVIDHRESPAYQGRFSAKPDSTNDSPATLMANWTRGILST